MPGEKLSVDKPLRVFASLTKRPGYLALSDAYVLLQMRKDANDSNLDAVIYRKVPGEKFDNLIKKISRKQLRMQSYSDEGSSERADVPVPTGGSEHLVLGVNTGAKEGGRRSEGVEELLKLVKGAFRDEKQLFRSKKFEFNDAGSPGSPTKKSSVGIELNTQSLIEAVRKFISSRKFKKTADEVARKAAIIVKALREDM